MIEFVFDLRRFGDDELTDDEKEQIQKSSLPRLRMLSTVAKNPIFKKLTDVLEAGEDVVNFISRDVAPIYNFVAACYKRKFDKNAKLHLVEDAAIFTSTVKIIDQILESYDACADFDLSKMPLEVSEKLTTAINEALKIANNIGKKEGDDGLFLTLVTLTLSYGISLLSTLDGLEPEEQAAINKALTKLGGTTAKSLAKELLKDGDALAAPFGLADLGIAAAVGLVEGLYQYDSRLEYYRDDGLPENYAMKEATAEAVLSGMYEASTTYLKGIDNVAVDLGYFLGEGCKWVYEQAKAFFTDKNYTPFEYTALEKNYMEGLMEIARAGGFGTTDSDDIIEVDEAGAVIYTQDGNDRIYNKYPNVKILAGHGKDSISLYKGATGNSVVGSNGDDYIYSEDDSGTLYGGKDDDFFLVLGNANEIYGEAGKDVIFVKGSNNTVTGGAGNDLIILEDAANSVIEYTQGDGQDVIFGYTTNTLLKIKGEYSTQVSGDDVIIQVGKGGIIVKDAKDLIVNTNTVELEEGETLPTEQGALIANPYDNAIILMPSFQGSKNVLRGTNGDDQIENTLDNIMIYGFAGDDTIYNYGKNVTINAGDGQDKVFNYGTGVKINGGEGNDYIYNEAATVTANGGDGADTIENSGKNSRLDGGDGMDSIKNSGENTDINSGYGNDDIANFATSVRISGYFDDNYITNTKSNVTLSGGDDNDYIYNSGDKVSINAGNGNNSVSIDGSADGYQTVIAGDGSNTVRVGERDETEEKRSCNRITVGDGGNYINNSNVELSTITAGNGNDTIITGGSPDYGDSRNHVSIVAGAGDNRITVNSDMNHGEIYAGGGNDLVSIAGGWGNIISVSGGDDSVIASNSGSTTINVGAGKNFVTLNAGSYQNNIVAGSGDDYVIMNSSGGNNSASLGSGKNTLISANGYETATAGDGDDLITVKGGNLNVGGGKNNVSITYGGYSNVTAGDGDDTINVADKAEEATEGRYYHNINAGDGNNYINNSNVELSTISAGSGNDTIITGGGQGYEYNWNYDHSSIVAGAGDNRITVNSGMRMGAVYAGGGNDLVSVGGEGSNNIISVGDGRNTIYTSDYYDTNYNTNNTITAGTGSDLIYTSGNYMFVNAGSGRNSITLAGGRGNTLITGKGNDTINLAESANNNVIIFGGGEDLVVNYHSGDTVKAAGVLTQQTVGDDVILTDGTSTMTLKGAANKTVNTATLSSNDNVYKILVADKTVGDTLPPDNLPETTQPDTTPPDTTPPASNLIVTNATTSPLTIDETIEIVDATLRTKALRLTGNELANSIVGGKGADVIDGGAANDTIDGGKGNDTLTGGDGEDIFVASAGSDVIADYVSGEDKIDLGGTSVTGFSVGNGNTVLKFGKNSMTLKNVDGAAITFVDDDGETVKTYFNDRIVGEEDIAITLGANFKDKTFTAPEEIIKVDAEQVPKAFVLNGNNEDNILHGGKSAETLDGGDGDDLLRGGKGNDVFVLSNGSDTITDYTAGNDKISLGSSLESFSAEDGNLILISGNDSLTIVDGANRKITFVDGKKTSTQMFTTDQILNDKSTAVTLSASTTEYIATGKIISIDGSAASNGIELTGSASANYIVAGANGSTLDGGGGNDTLSGGTGTDFFLYASAKKSGKDVIQNFGEGDSLEISGATVTNAAVNAKTQDVVFTLSDKNTITIKKASAEISFTDDEGDKTFVREDGFIHGGDSVTIPAAFTPQKNVVVTFDEDISSIDANFSAKALNLATKNDSGVFIHGGTKNDSITGGDGSDTLWGGKGNDTLSGGDGADEFIYKPGEGKDTILDFTSDDLLTIDGGTFTKAVFNSDKLTLNLKGGSLVLTNVDASTEFNINGETYHVSGKTLTK